jgi:MlaD protein
MHLRSPWQTALLTLVACGAPPVGPVRHFTTSLCRLDDVREGSPVRVSGYQIGHVAEIRPETTGVRVRYRLTLDVTHPTFALRRGDHAVVRSIGVLGADALDIELGVRTAPMLQDGDSLPSEPRLATAAQRRSTVRIAAAVVGLPLVTVVTPPGSLRPDSTCAVP